MAMRQGSRGGKGEGPAVDALCRVRRIKEVHFHGAVLVFNLLEERILFVGVLLRI